MILQADRCVQVPLFCFLQLMISLVYRVDPSRGLIKSIVVLLN